MHALETIRVHGEGTIEDKADACVRWFVANKPDTSLRRQKLLRAWFIQTLEPKA